MNSDLPMMRTEICITNAVLLYGHRHDQSLAIHPRSSPTKFEGGQPSVFFLSIVVFMRRGGVYLFTKGAHGEKAVPPGTLDSCLDAMRAHCEEEDNHEDDPGDDTGSVAIGGVDGGLVSYASLDSVMVTELAG